MNWLSSISKFNELYLITLAPIFLRKN